MELIKEGRNLGCFRLFTHDSIYMFNTYFIFSRVWNWNSKKKRGFCKHVLQSRLACGLKSHQELSDSCSRLIRTVHLNRVWMMTSAQVWQGHPRRAISVLVTLMHVLQSFCRRAWPRSESSFMIHGGNYYSMQVKKKIDIIFIFEWLRYSFNRLQSHCLSVQTTNNTHYFSKWTIFSFSCHRKVSCFYCNGFENTTSLSPLEQTVFPVN